MAMEQAEPVQASSHVHFHEEGDSGGGARDDDNKDEGVE